ncbi:MAG: GxxExxY protein [Caldilineaceae bacterium]
MINKLREIILGIAHQYGLGYSETIYRKLIAIESRYHALNCLEETEVMARWEGTEIAKTTTPHLLISDKVLVYVRSLLENPTSYDFARTATYLSSLGLQVGLVVNFGRKQLQIIGVSTNKLHQS